MNKLVQRMSILAILVSLPLATTAQWNLSFENWSNNTFYSHPADFRSNMAQAWLVTGSPHITQVSGQSGSAIRLENVDDGNGDVITAQVTKGPLFYILGEAESYTGNPTSVTVRCKPQMVGTDSATIQFVFKNAGGTPIGIFSMKIGGNTSTWEDHSRNFNISGTPATVNVTIESYNQSQTDPYEIGSAIEVDHIEFGGTTEQPQNNGFDDWFDVQSEEPNEWITPNFLIPTMDAAGSDLSVTKVSGGTDGNFAAEVKTVEVPFVLSTLKFGFVGNGTPSIFGSQGSTGIPHYAKSANITFDYKYEPQGGDVALVYARFSDDNGDSINGTIEVLPPSSTFTSHELTFDWSGIDAPSSLLLYFSSSGDVANGAGNVNSTLTIDNIFIDGSTGIDDPLSGYGNGISIIPNPAQDAVSIRFENEFHGKAQLTVYDMLGRTVAKKEVINNEPVSLDLSQWNTGQYLYKLTTGDKTYSGKFVKQ